MSIDVKFCGLMRAQDVRLCHDLGVNTVGFVVEYPIPVPWNLTVEQARPLLAEVTQPMKSCVVTGGDREKIVALAQTLSPNIVQLHCDETIADAQYIAEQLAPRGIHVIKTLPRLKGQLVRQFGASSLADCLRLMNESDLYAVLVDSRSPANAANPSCPADLSWFMEVRKLSNKPVILAGGINGENIRETLLSAQPDFIDVMSGVESAPGIKERTLMETILAACRNA